ncbi:MAG: hypothetical protein CM15mP22_7930 [Gammaproteobacteria bacterium]|nr:MAG: hypothetical protein CM15mP22_7930 [Gammaproteobacteria bacterium]
MGDDKGSRERQASHMTFLVIFFFEGGSIKLYKQETDQQQITNKERLFFAMFFFWAPFFSTKPMAVSEIFSLIIISGITFEMNKQLKFGERMIHD